MTSADPAYPPTGTYPPPPSNYNAGQQTGTQFGQPLGTQFGQPMGTQFGQPMGAQYGQPMGAQFGQSIVVQQPMGPGQTSTSVIVIPQAHLVRSKHGGRPCRHCQVGIVTNQPTALGWILCFLFFPFGMICCVLMAERKCSNCKVPQN